MMGSFSGRSRVDTNQAEIISTLKKAGCTVLSLTRLGGGAPDLLAARGGKMWLMEVKTNSGMVRKEQKDWAKSWNAPVHVVRSSEEALGCLTFTVKTDR